MAKEPAAVASNRDSLWHQITDANQHMSEVSVVQNALQQEMMHRTACKSCDDSSMNSQPRTRPESRQLHSQVRCMLREQVNKRTKSQQRYVFEC